MPPKHRKNSKTPSSRHSFSDQSVSPRSSSSSSTPAPESEIYDESFYFSLLEDASIKFPYLISKSAFAGQVIGSKPYSGSNATTIWLSESAFYASSITPGSIVSVSLASSRKELFAGFPLDSLTDKSWDAKPNKVGNFFALAKTYPSSKVFKNGVQLSWNLSCTMGHPASGKITFVYPIQTCSINGNPNGNHKLQNSNNMPESWLSLCNCKDLYLELVPSNNGSQKNDDLLSPINSTLERRHDRFENGEVSSPKTPLSYQSKLKCPSVSLERCQESVTSVPHSNETLCDGHGIDEATTDQKKEIEEALGDKSSREIYQTCAKLWLHGRFLLHGNVVAIPLHKNTYCFRIEDADSLTTECHSQELVNGGRDELSGHEVQTHDVDNVNLAFVLDAETKVHLYPSLPLKMQIPSEKVVLEEELKLKNRKDKEAGHVSKLGGLSKEFAVLKEIIVSSVKDTLSSLGLRTTRGVLLHGPPGTGKTSLAHACVRDAGIKLFSINGPEIISQFHGESEQALHEVFDSASQAAPAVVFIDELDAIAPARKDGGEELSQRVVATLLNLMDGISRTDRVLVIAASNRPDTIDPALRRPGRLDREIEIGVPSPKQRLDVLLCLLNRMDHSLTDSQVQNLASATHGFVGSDLAALCNEAALFCLRRHVGLKKAFDSAGGASDIHSKVPCPGHDNFADVIMEEYVSSNDIRHMLSMDQEDSASSLSSDLTKTVQSFGLSVANEQGIKHLQNSVHFSCGMVASVMGEEALLKVAFDDFEKAKMRVRPSAMREVILEVPKVRWVDVGGQNEVKKQLMEAVEWPQKHQDAFKRIGTRPPTGVLMFGPPGCSKTLLARAVASEAGLNFLAVKGPELFSKWVGESEKAVRSLFAKARANAPSIIFFDEIDGLAIVRGQENDGASVSDRVMSQLLVELDGLHQRVDVTVIAATNRPDKIDSALLRPGRFDRLLYVGPPNEVDREEIFHIHVQKMPCCSDVSIRELSILTRGYTGADISLICREAAVAAIEESLEISEISMAHFETALGRVQPSEVQSYQEFLKKFQRLVCSDATRDEMESQASPSSSNQITFWTRIKSLVPIMRFRLPSPS